MTNKPLSDLEKAERKAAEAYRAFNAKNNLFMTLTNIRKGEKLQAEWYALQNELARRSGGK